MSPLDVELIRFAYLACAAIVLLIVGVGMEWWVRRRFEEGVPPSLTWTLRGLLLFGLLFVTAPILGWVSFTEAAGHVHYALNATLFQVGEQQVTLSGILTFVLLLVVTVAASRIIRRALTRSQAVQRATDAGTVGVIERLVHYGIMAVGITVALTAAGVNLSGLVTAGAAFAVGIGFALQGVAQNFVSGLILLVERAIKPGDILEVEGTRVRVQKMGIRSTIVRTRTDLDLIVPNNTLAQSTVTNFTLLDNRRRIQASVGVAYESDMRLVFSVLQDAADGFAGRDPEPTPQVIMTGIGASTVDFEVSIWTHDAWRDRAVLSDLYLCIWEALAAAEISIAFPQMDVHIDGGVTATPFRETE